jgi:hypothetical protein
MVSTVLLNCSGTSGMQAKLANGLAIDNSMKIWCFCSGRL